jgi:hypothetical protein
VKQHTPQQAKGKPGAGRNEEHDPFMEDVKKRAAQVDYDHDDDQQSQEEKLLAEIIKKYTAAMCTHDVLKSLPITPRNELIGNWMREGDLGFAYGHRGDGKTWFGYILISHLSRGDAIDEDWPVVQANVLLVDGEMPIDETRNRLRRTRARRQASVYSAP